MKLLFSALAILALFSSVDAKKCRSRPSTSVNAGSAPATSSSSSAPAVQPETQSSTPASSEHASSTPASSEHASSTSAESSGSAPAASASPTTSSGTPACNAAVNGVCLGFLPDYSDKVATYNQWLGAKASVYGDYAQVQDDNFDGSQLTQHMNDVKASGVTVYEAAVMPTGGWNGFTSDNNGRAQKVCQVMKGIVDTLGSGVEVRLRFAHEVNWYQADASSNGGKPTYPGGVSDFKAGWAAVASACKSTAPTVKMFYTPNMGGLSDWERYFPDDPKSVDYIGVDYYPSANEVSKNANLFTSTFQAFYDKYTSGDYSHIHFAMGETGLQDTNASEDQKIAWLKSITSAKSSMPKLVSVAWFNYVKSDYGGDVKDFKILEQNTGSQLNALLDK